MTALLASVRSSEEALDAAQAGAELIDLKEPGSGALGDVSLPEIARIVAMLRATYPVKPISATIGDVATEEIDEITERVIEVSNTGVDYVKVGVTPGAAARRCLRLRRHDRDLASRWRHRWRHPRAGTPARSVNSPTAP